MKDFLITLTSVILVVKIILKIVLSILALYFIFNINTIIPIVKGVMSKWIY